MTGSQELLGIAALMKELHEVVPPELLQDKEGSRIEWDSLGVIIAMTNAQEKWGITLDFEAVIKTERLNDLAHLILRERSGERTAEDRGCN